MRISVSMVSAALFVLCGLWRAEASGRVVEINIDAPTMAKALIQFTQQSGLHLIFPTDGGMAKLPAPRVVGTYTPEEALEKLLRNTGLEYEYVDSRTIAVRPAGAVSTTEAEKRGLIEAQLAQVGDGKAQGEQRAVRKTAEETTSRANTSRASSGVAENKAQEIIVTGTRFGDRTSLTSPVPVDIVTAEQLRAAGHTELAESISATVPAFNFRPVAAGNVVSSARQFTYRGLPPNEVLVLVNGKRWHPTAVSAFSTFDFNSIAPTSVGSVEVLRDGAAAQYGSDAIGGVINVRLRTDTRTELTSTIGQYYAGDGLTLESAFDTGMAFRGDGFVRMSAYFRDTDTTNRQGRDVRQQYFARNAAGQPVTLPVVNTQTDLTPVVPAGFSLDSREGSGVDRLNNSLLGNADRREAGVSFNSELPLDNGVTVYAFGGFMRRIVDTPLSWRLPRDNTNVRAIYPDGYAPVDEARVSDLQATAGVKGRWGAWDWDLSQAWGSSKVAVYVDDTLNPSLGAASPTSFYTGAQRLSQATTNLDFRRELDVGLRSPVRLAMGTEFRHESMETQSGEPASYINGGVPILDGPSAGGLAAVGSQGFGGFPPADVIDVSRHSIAGYLDIENQLTESLLLALAGRYEHYSDFGSTTNGKLAFRYAFAEPFAIRGSVSTGFRAPSLMESYFSRTASGVLSGQFVTNRIFPVSDPVAQALGATALEPEKSVSYSFGLVTSLFDRFTFTADAYRTYVRDTIILSSAFSDAGTRNFLAARGFVGVGSAQFSTNAVDKRVDGIDLVGDYVTPLRGGAKLTLSLGANFNDPKVQSVDPTPAALAAVTSIPLFNQISVVTLEQGVPRTRVNLAVGLDYRRARFLLRGTRYGSVQEGCCAPLVQDFGAKWITDLDVVLDVNETLQITMGGQNLFNVYPDEYIANLNSSGVFKYSPSGATFGLSGGFYYVRALLRF